MVAAWPWEAAPQAATKSRWGWAIMTARLKLQVRGQARGYSGCNQAATTLSSCSFAPGECFLVAKIGIGRLCRDIDRMVT